MTAQSKLPKSVTNAAYTAAWAVDIEADGDLDIVLGSKDGVPAVLRNDGDDTFLAIHPFTGISGLSSFAWADFDGDGNPDAAIIDGTGHLHIFMNERQGQFRERPLPTGISPVKAIAVADANNDGILDLLAVEADGAILRISDKNEGESWETAEIAKVPTLPEILRVRCDCGWPMWTTMARSICILSPARGSRQDKRTLIWLGDEKGSFVLLKPPSAPRPALGLVFTAADLRGDGNSILLGLTADGRPCRK